MWVPILTVTLLTIALALYSWWWWGPHRRAVTMPVSGQPGQKWGGYAEQVDDYVPALTKADRCDGCGAEAKVRATVNGTILLFCGHHADKHLPKLRPIATDIVDDRELEAS
jgi:hypothetical protein